MKRLGDEINRLKTMVDLEARKESEAAQALGESRRRHDEHAGRLKELRRYQQEYQDRYHILTTDGLRIERMNAYRMFVDRLIGVIRQQENSLQVAAQQLKACEANWRQAHARKEGMEKLLEQRRHEQRMNRARVEQMVSDDRVYKRFEDMV